MGLMSDTRLGQEEKTVMLLELAKQLFWPFWRVSVGFGSKYKVSDKYRKKGKETSEIPELLEMFGEQFLGRPLHLCLRHLYFKMPNDMVGELCIVD